MLCFLNASGNKHNLRDMGLLPEPGDTACQVEQKLREAFLSHQTPGTWRIGPKEDDVLPVLLKAKLLASGKASRDEVFAAMQAYAQYHKLPEMRNPKGLALRIKRHNNRNPTRRAPIEFTRDAA
ncbi:unnamed protein product [Effrenium voratum]|nr:unnamed protein product [Effrenium voratum]